MRRVSSSRIAHGCTLALHKGSVREQRVRSPAVEQHNPRGAATRARRLELAHRGEGGRARTNGRENLVDADTSRTNYGDT